jgi:ABC-2 type transport system ATP-binding protein
MTWGVESLTVRYGDTTALADVSLDIAAEGITAVVGGDGAGKTTLARVMVGLAPVISGRIRRPERIGFQPESSGVWRDLTVLENLHLVAGAYRLGEGETRQRIEELLDVTALGDARDRLGGHLSGGMRQKLGVAMALLPRPELLVLDEPTTGLDPVSRLELWAFIATAASRGTAVLLTTGYLDEAARAATILALDSGRALAAGSREEVVAAMPGRVFESRTRVGEHSWRRGRAWRVWSPDGTPPEGTRDVEPDLADAVMAAAFAGERPA